MQYLWLTVNVTITCINTKKDVYPEINLRQLGWPSCFSSAKRRKGCAGTAGGVKNNDSSLTLDVPQMPAHAFYPTVFLFHATSCT